MGRPLMGWQQYVADVGLEIEYDDDGRWHWAYQLVVVTVPRQSGKTTLFGAVLGQRAVLVPLCRAWFTMQTQKDAVDWLTNEYWPLLARFGSAVSLRRMAGSENVKFHPTGGLIRPFPPSPVGLHGKVSDVVVLDECWAFDLVRGQQLDQAIVPTQATRGDRAQVWKLSTAGDALSLWWLGTVEAGRASVVAGKTSGIAYFEWSAPDDVEVTSPEAWPTYHPAYGRTIDAAAMRAALAILGPDDFARAYGNRWVSMVARVIPLQSWRDAQDENAPMPEPGNVALGFDVALDRSDAAIVAAWRQSDGVARVEIADYRPGVGWLPDRIGELVDRWQPTAFGYDAAGPALDVADVLGRRGLPIDGLKARDYAAACSGFLGGLTSAPPGILIRPHAALDAAAGAAGRRAVADAWAWGRRQSATSIAPLTAATVALWAYDHAKAATGPFRIF